MRERKKVIWVCSKLLTVKNLRTQNLKNSYIFTKHIVQLHTHSWIHEGIKSRATIMKDIDTSYANTINPLFFNMRTWHAFTIIAPYLFRSFHIFATCLQGENLSKSIFCQVDEIMERLIGMNISNLKSNIEIINFEIYV